MRKLALSVATMFVVACGGASVAPIPTKGIASDAEATAAVGEAFVAVQGLQASMTPARAGVTVNVTFKCDTGTAKGSYSGDGSAAGGTITWDITFSKCAKGDKLFDGGLKYSYVIATNPTKVTVDLSGTVNYTGPVYSGTFGFTGFKIVFDSSLKGTDAISVTGSFTIGSKTYTVDKTAAIKMFGG